MYLGGDRTRAAARVTLSSRSDLWRAADSDRQDGVASPVCHGATTAETFLLDVAKVVQEQFMARDPENVNFNLVALCKTE
jgi:hypothetical protein